MHLAILHAALFTPTRKGWGLPILLVDEPGTGKSSIVEAYAARCGFPCEVLSPGERGEGAFGVVPVPTKAGVLSYPPPEWTARFDPKTGAGCGVVFVDEVTTAPPLLQAPMLGLVHDKRIGGTTLGPRVRVIGACNPAGQAANGYDLSPPLANRFGWLHWGAPSVDEHTAYMLGTAGGQDGNAIDAEAEEDRVMAEWGGAFARAVGLETAFLGAQPHWKNKCPKPGEPAASAAWPSDRSWEMATRAFASALVHKLTPADTDTFVAGFIGREAYEAFSVFVEQADLPQVADVLDGKVKYTPEPARLDRTAAVLNAATALVAPSNATARAARAGALWKLCAAVGDSHQDLIVPVAQALTQASLHTLKEAQPVLAKLQATLAAANQAVRK